MVSGVRWLCSSIWDIVRLLGIVLWWILVLVLVLFLVSSGIDSVSFSLICGWVVVKLGRVGISSWCVKVGVELMCRCLCC